MKLLNESLVLPERYSLTAEATSYVAGLMMEAEGIPLPPTDAQGQQHAVIMGREMRKHLSEVEMTRKLLVGPLNDTTVVGTMRHIHVWECEVSALPDCADLVDTDFFTGDFQ